MQLGFFRTMAVNGYEYKDTEFVVLNISIMFFVFIINISHRFSKIFRNLNIFASICITSFKLMLGMFDVVFVTTGNFYVIASAIVGKSLAIILCKKLQEKLECFKEEKKDE